MRPEVAPVREITVQFVGLFQILSGVSEVKLDARSGLTMVKLICVVASLFPDLGEYLGDLDSSQLFNSKVSVLVNGVHVFRRDEVVRPSDTVALIVPLCGG